MVLSLVGELARYDHFLRIVGMSRVSLQPEDAPPFSVTGASPRVGAPGIPRASRAPQPRVGASAAAHPARPGWCSEAAIDRRVDSRLEGLYAARAVILRSGDGLRDALLEDYGDSGDEGDVPLRWAFRARRAARQRSFRRWFARNHPEGRPWRWAACSPNGRSAAWEWWVRTRPPPQSSRQATGGCSACSTPTHRVALRHGGRPGASDFGLFGTHPARRLRPDAAAIALGSRRGSWRGWTW